MVETVGLIILEAVGLGALASEVLFGTITVGAVVGATVVVAGAVGLQMVLDRPLQQAGGNAARAARTQTGSSTVSGSEAGHQALKQPIPPRVVGYGRNRLAGAYMLYEERDGVSYDIIAFHHGRIGGIVGFYLHDDVVERHAITGIVQPGTDGRYDNDTVFIAFRDGVVPNVHYGEATGPLPEIWTTSHRGDGIASLFLQCNAVSVEDFTRIYPRGKPEPSVVADCAPIFNPLDVTQTRENPATWTVNNNPVLQLLDVLTNTDRGMGLDWDVLVQPVLTTLMNEVNLCATFVPKVGGSELRYRSDGFYTLDSDPIDAVNTILDTCDGWLSENGDGTLALKVGVYREPTVTFTSNDIKGFSIQKGTADEDVVNELVIDYTDPLLDYKTAPGEPWQDPVSIAEVGKIRSQRFSLPWVQSPSQARRLAKRRMAQLNAPLRGTITTSLYGLTALGERWIKVEAPEIADLANLVIEVRGVTVDLLNSRLVFTFQSVNPNEIDAWDPATEEGTSVFVPEKLISPPPPIPVNLAVTQRPGIQFGDYIFEARFAPPNRSDLWFQVRYKINGAPGGFFTDLIREAYFTGDGTMAIIGGYQILQAQTWEVQIRSRVPSGVFSDFSDSSLVVIQVPEPPGGGPSGGG